MRAFGFLARGKPRDVVQAESRSFAFAGDSWRPLSFGQAPWEQIGVYGDRILTQYPAYYNEPQLKNGVSGLSSALYTPTISAVPTFQQTQGPVNLPGAGKLGQTFTGPMGPLGVSAMKARVTQAQVRQGGSAALSWARSLTGG